MRVVVLGFLLFASGLVTRPIATASGQTYWLEVFPVNRAELTLRAALDQGPSSPLELSVDLLAVSRTFPGTSTSGLAELAAGLALLDADRPADAIPCLQHPDVQRTALVEYALMGLGRAQEALGDDAAAAVSFGHAAAARPTSAPPLTPFICTALVRSAAAASKAQHRDDAIAALEHLIPACPELESPSLLLLGNVQEARRDFRAAAAAYDRLEEDDPASPSGREASKRLRTLKAYRPARTPLAEARHALKRGLGFFDAGRFAEAATVLRGVQSRFTGEDSALARVRLGRALFSLGRSREARVALTGVPGGSGTEAEAAFLLARIETQTRKSPLPLESVARRFLGTPWAEEALLSLANASLKENRDDEAVSYFRRLLSAYPNGRYVDRATWRVGWSAYRHGRYDEAAQLWEQAARVRPMTGYTPAYLYWSGRARARLGEQERSQALFRDTVTRFQHTYHGLRARAALSVPPPPTDRTIPAVPQRGEIPEPHWSRIRQLMLIDRFDEAIEELRTLPPGTRVGATLAWLEWRRGRLRTAINTMKRAYPDYVSAAGDGLPEGVWQILYPLAYRDLLLAKSRQQNLDPALVAAVIWQESTFDATALSTAGARGLMQLMPPTGRRLARTLGLKYREDTLHDPALSLEFGTRYLRQMLDHFGGRVERALAAYNAGPSRVVAWTAATPGMSEEEFVESIPFNETRNYVISILANREEYRRLYGLTSPAAQPSGSGRP